MPVADGWLVEETVLAGATGGGAGRPARLVSLLGSGGIPTSSWPAPCAREVVRIPMGGPLPAPDQTVVAFGAAAGYIHPATGYSIAGSLRAVDRVR